ncbi:MAG: hypothetical protein A2252_11880 [Elusimicrobia bacterium RIFOXYA2_FULL_39_19]|nr:MAG: hypothetical protein A2252_11880 [Elusimicrobia bacterium RIFOXYA2_FULL_39_19]
MIKEELKCGSNIRQQGRVACAFNKYNSFNILLLAFLIICLPIIPIKAAIFSDGFEDGLGQWGVSGNATISDDQAHGGLNSLKTVSSGYAAKSFNIIGPTSDFEIWFYDTLDSPSYTNASLTIDLDYWDGSIYSWRRFTFELYVGDSMYATEYLSDPPGFSGVGTGSALRTEGWHKMTIIFNQDQTIMKLDDITLDTLNFSDWGLMPTPVIGNMILNFGSTCLLYWDDVTVTNITTTIPPTLSPITDLQIEECSVKHDSVGLTWTSPGTDEKSYDIRYRESQITEENWDSANQCIGETTPLSEGTRETFTVNVPKQGAQYYFAIKTADNASPPNVSELSNVVNARILLDVPYFNQKRKADSTLEDWASDTYWATTQYNEIGNVGCHLTSVAMIIKYYKQYHSSLNMRTYIPDTDPKIFNKWLEDNIKDVYGIDFPEGYAAEIYTQGAIRYSRPKQRNDFQVNLDLKNKYPSILKVLHDDDEEHFVVVTGSCPGVGYKINDPGWRARKDLSYYNNKTYVEYRGFRAGYSRESTPVILAKALSQSPIFVELLLTNSEGEKTGFDPISYTTKEEIINSRYFLDAIQDSFTGEVDRKWKELDVESPLIGKYALYIVGRETGTYKVDVFTMNSSFGVVTKEFVGSISENEIKKIFINYSSVPGEQTQIFEDNTPPITYLKSEGIKFNAFNTTYITPNTIMGFEATDPVAGEGSSGVKYTEYRINGIDWLPYTSTFTITTEGQYIIEYRSVDNVGNIEEIKSQTTFVTIIPEYVLIGINGIKINGNPKIAGNIRSNGDINLTGKAIVYGDAYAEKIDFTGKSTVTGQIIQNALKTNPTPIDLEEISTIAIQNNDNNIIPLTQKGRNPLDKNLKFKMTDKDSITLSTGLYYFTEMDISGNSTINVNGNVNIFCTGKIKLTGKSVLNYTSNANNLIIFVNKNDKSKEAEKIEITGDSQVKAIIYAPYSAIEISGNTNIAGYLFGLEGRVSGAATLKSPIITINNVVSMYNKASIASLNIFADPTFKLGEIYSYPNPAKQTNPKIHIEVGVADKLEIKIFNMNGEQIHSANLTDLPQVIDNKYVYDYEWDTTNIVSGIYLYVIYAEKQGEKPIKVTRKLGIIK